MTSSRTPRGRHRTKVSLLVLLSALLVATLTAALSGVFQQIGGSVTERGIDMMASDRITAKVTPVSDLVDPFLVDPDGETLPPPFECVAPVNETVKRKFNIVPADNYWRIDVSGLSSKEVVLTGLRMDNLDTEEVSDRAFMTGCRAGGEMGVPDVALGINPPRVSYFSSNGKKRRQLNYRLEENEQGVFYVWHMGSFESGRSVSTFRLVLEYTSKNGTHEIDLTPFTPDKQFKVASTCDLPTLYNDELTDGEWQDLDFPPSPCDDPAIVP